MNIPLHPAIVHFPIGGAFVAALVSLYLLLILSKGKTTDAAWRLVFFLQLVVLISGLVANKTGENEEETAVKVVEKQYIHEHEERAEGFLIAAGITAFLSLLACLADFKKSVKWIRPFQALSVLGGLVSLALVLYTGKAGGELVYKHQAPRAYLESTNKSE